MKVPGAALARRLAWAVASSTLVPHRYRPRMLARLGLAGAEYCWVGPGVSLVDPTTITLGNECFLNAEVFLERQITIGERVYIGPRAMVVSGDHPIGPPLRRAADGRHRPVTIGDGTWIGAGAIILPGTTIGEGCVIGAGAVVTRDCEPNGLYLGVPARRVRDLPDEGYAR